jgi:hypothetical protein
LSGQIWPESAQADVRSLVDENETLSSSLQAMRSQGPSVAAEEEIFRIETKAQQSADRVRKDLGLPPPA